MTLHPADQREQGLFFRSQNRVFCRLRDPEFHHGLCGDLDLLLRLGIDADSRFPLLLHQFPKAGQHEFAVLLDLLVAEAGERIQEKRGRSFVRLGRFGQSDLKFGFGHLDPCLMATEQFSSSHIR